MGSCGLLFALAQPVNPFLESQDTGMVFCKALAERSSDLLQFTRYGLRAFQFPA